METWMWVVGVLVIIGFFYMVLFNRIISFIQRRKNAFSDIDVQLKLRHDLIPNLIETVKGYASHEKELLESVTEARATAMKGGSIDDKIGAESALGAAMMNLMAVAENYPDLKANQNFMQLQDELSDIENKIAAARRFFNSATNEYNVGIQQFPANIVAGIHNYKEEIFFEMSTEEKKLAEKPPEVKF